MTKEIERKSLMQVEGYGYAYAKYINVVLINQETSYPDLLRIYKTIYKTPLNSLIDLDRDLLIAPLAIAQ